MAWRSTVFLQGPVANCECGAQSVIIWEMISANFIPVVNLPPIVHIHVSYFVPMFIILTDHQIRHLIHNVNDAAP